MMLVVQTEQSHYPENIRKFHFYSLQRQFLLIVTDRADRNGGSFFDRTEEKIDDFFPHNKISFQISG